MLEVAQMSQIKKLYPDLKGILERPPTNLQFEGSEDQEPTTTHETVYPECEFSIHFRLFTDPYMPVKSPTPYYVVPTVQISHSCMSYQKNS